MAADRDVDAGAEALLVGDERGANVIWRAEIVLDGLPVIRVLGPRASGPPDVVVPRIGADVTVDTLLR